MDRFCRGCLVRYDEPTELLQYTEKNRRLFVYSTGLQVKRNDTFTFQLCRDCYLNMKVACNFKKQCRSSDKRFKSYTALKEEGDSVDFCTYLKNNDDAWTFRFPLLYGNSTPASYRRNKDDDNESTTTSIRNFMTDIMPDEDIPDTEAKIIREVIEEEADVLEDSLDSHWLQDDVSIDTDFRLDFNFSPFASPRSVNNDAYTPKKPVKSMDKMKQNHEKSIKTLVAPVPDILPIKTTELNHKLDIIAVKEEPINPMGGVNDLFAYDSGDDLVQINAPAVCTIDRNLEEALKNEDNNEFSLDDLLVSPKDIANVSTPLTPTIRNILFGEKIDPESENSNMSNGYKIGQCIETYQNVDGDLDISDKFDDSVIKLENFEFDDNENQIDETDDTKEVTEDMYDVETCYCKVCEKSFKSPAGLKYHMLVRHNVKCERVKRNERKFICDFCGKVCNERTNFLRHIKTHNNTRLKTNYKCPNCPLEFNQEHILKMHLRVHDGSIYTTEREKKLVCPECGLRSNKLSNFKIHLRRHSKTYTYQCKECDKGFFRNFDLTVHMRQHTGEKPYRCTFCRKSFKRHDVLSKHIKRKHLDEQKFECQICGSKFAREYDLKIHTKLSKTCLQKREQLAQQTANTTGPVTIVHEEIHMKEIVTNVPQDVIKKSQDVIKEIVSNVPQDVICPQNVIKESQGVIKEMVINVPQDVTEGPQIVIKEPQDVIKEMVTNVPQHVTKGPQIVIKGSQDVIKEDEKSSQIC